MLFESQTGKRQHAEWGSQLEAEPIGIDPTGKLAIVAGHDLMQTIDMRTAKPGWVYHFQAPQALSGEQPRVLCREGRIFVLLAYNYGYLLECLDAQTGKRAWPRDILAGSRPLDLELGDADDQAVYCSGPAGIEAHSLADGRLLWKQRSDISTFRVKFCAAVLP